MIKAAENHPRIIALANDLQALIKEQKPELSDRVNYNDILAWLMCGDYEALESWNVTAEDVVDEWFDVVGW